MPEEVSAAALPFDLCTATSSVSHSMASALIAHLQEAYAVDG